MSTFTRPIRKLNPSNPTAYRWWRLFTALTLASLCLITLFALLLASPPANTIGPFPIVTVILQQGDSPPNGGGLSVVTVNSPVTNGSGQVGFSGSLENVNNDIEFIWYDTALTWLSTSLVTDVLSIEEVIGLSNNGSFAYSLLLESNVDSLWTDEGLLLATADPAPGITGHYILSLSRPTMQANGMVNWFATISDTPGGTPLSEVIYRATDVSAPIITPLLQGGAVISGVTVANNGLDPDFFVSDNGAHFITLIQTTEPVTQDDYIYLDGALLLREGSPTGAGDNWDNFDLFQVNNSGNYVVSGDTDGNAASDEFIAYNGAIQVREGDTIDGVTLVNTANVHQLSLNNLGQAAYTWGILGGQEVLFFTCDAADLAGATAVLRTNDQVDTNADGEADATISDFNASTAAQSFMLAEDGQIYVGVDLNYGSGSVEAVIRYPLPSCTGNTPPVAANDNYTTTQATPLTIAAPGVLMNDSDEQGDLLTAVPIQTTSHGNLNLNGDGSFTYTPNTTFFGTDNFTYRAYDGVALSNLATAFITVTSSNPNPGLEVSPLSLESIQPADTTTTQTLTISNTGSSNLSWEIGRGPVITHENGPLVNLPGSGPEGADASLLQNNSLGMVVLGFGNSVADNNRLADDFTITDADGWFVDTATFYAYQTNAPISSTITAVNLRLWDGPPNSPTSTIIFGDVNTNRLISSDWTGAYRISESTVNTTRPIMANRTAVHTYLPPGTYWLDWLSEGSDSFTGPWAPPIVISHVITTGNGMQLSGGGWGTATDTGQDNTGTHAPQGFPFQLTAYLSDCQQPAWATVSPDSNILAAGTADHVTVTFDSTGLGAGTYTGELCLTSSDSNNPFLRLPITLTSVAPALILTTTIGISDDECATNSDLYTPQAVTAYYCYTVTNNGNIPFTLHSLEASQFGTILSAFPATLAPGASFDTVSLGLIFSATITANSVNTATWTAYNPGPTDTAVATDTASVIIGTPGIVFTPTVGINPTSCAPESTILVPIGTAVYYCYEVTNTGEVPLEVHTLTDSAYGPILTNYTHTLSPGDSFNTVAAGITNMVQVMTNTVSTAVWSARNGPLIHVTGNGTTIVNAYTIHTSHLPFVIRP